MHIYFAQGKISPYLYADEKKKHLSYPDFNGFYITCVLQHSQLICDHGWHMHLLHWSTIDVYKYT